MKKEVAVSSLRRDLKSEANSWVIYTVAAVLFIVTVLGITWMVQGGDFFLYKVFAPKYEAVRRDTFEQSKAYNQGMAQDLQRMMFEYIQAPDDKKAALGAIILHRTADYDTTRLNPELQTFIDKLRAQGTQP